MIKKINLLFVAILFIAQQGMGQEWLVPEDQKALTNPSEYNLSNVKKGKDLYNLNCKSCHGDAGKNNALPLVPVPPDVVIERLPSVSPKQLISVLTAAAINSSGCVTTMLVVCVQLFHIPVFT